MGYAVKNRNPRTQGDMHREIKSQGVRNLALAFRRFELLRALAFRRGLTNTLPIEIIMTLITRLILQSNYLPKCRSQYSQLDQVLLRGWRLIPLARPP